jgi:hypothetical protein
MRFNSNVCQLPPSIVFGAEDDDEDVASASQPASSQSHAATSTGVPPGVDPTVHAITVLLAKTAGWV